MEIDGQVTISLKTFNQLQNRAKQADELKKKMQDLQEEITDIIDQIDESEAEPIFREIDDSNMTDKQIQKRFDEAIAKFRIILDPEKTKRLIQKYIEKDRRGCEERKPEGAGTDNDHDESRGGINMAAGWSVMDALNKNSKAAAEEKPKARFRTRDISIRKIYSNDRNFYSMPGIEQLAQEILAVGLMENMTVAYAPCERGEYKIIAGERRWRALNLLLEKGYEDFETVTCQIKSAAEENEEMV